MILICKECFEPVDVDEERLGEMTDDERAAVLQGRAEILCDSCSVEVGADRPPPLRTYRYEVYIWCDEITTDEPLSRRASEVAAKNLPAALDRIRAGLPSLLPSPGLAAQAEQ
jgi:hypothetical protein